MVAVKGSALLSAPASARAASLVSVSCVALTGPHESGGVCSVVEICIPAEGDGLAATEGLGLGFSVCLSGCGESEAIGLAESDSVGPGGAAAAKDSGAAGGAAD